MHRGWIVGGLALGFGVFGAAFWMGSSSGAPVFSPQPEASRGPRGGQAFEPEARWIAVSGGAEPASNPYSLVQDLEAAREVLGEGYAFFAGGPGSYTQRGAAGGAQDLAGELAAFFDPRDRQVEYVAAPPWVQGPTRSDTVLAALAEVQGQQAPLFVYLGGHGEGGSSPAESVLYLWGGDAIGVPEVASALQAGPRPVRMLVTSCFGGGFAEVIYRDGDRSAGDSPNMVCGVFAATSDREASGCDPNPDRAAQESYVAHLWDALRGQDRNGQSISIDFDGDGAVSLLEAHAQARAFAASMDVPTTTSFRHLMAEVEEPRKHGEAVEGLRVGEQPIPMPEEDWVIEHLGARLGIDDDIEAMSEHRRAEAALGDADEALAMVEQELDLHYASLRIALLEVVPFLDDPFHPQWREAVEGHRGELSALLHDAPVGRNHAAVQAHYLELQGAYEEALIAEALHKRLRMAYEAKAAALVLRHIGGEPWERWLALRQCENGTLPRP